MATKIEEQIEAAREIQVLLERKRHYLKELDNVNVKIQGIISSLNPKTQINHNGIQNFDHYLIRVMAPGAHMTPAKIAAAMQQLGFKTNSKSFAGYLAAKMKKRKDIIRISHGTYMRKAGQLPQIGD